MICKRNSYPLILVFILVLLFNIVGCTESSFRLSKESRLPKWFDVPDKLSRDRFQVTMDYYSKPGKGLAVFTLYDSNNNKLEQVTGDLKGIHPIKLKKQPEGFPEGRVTFGRASERS